MELLNSTQHEDSLGVMIESSVLPSPLYTGLWGMLIVFGLYELWFRNSHSYQKLKNIPGPYRWPIIGNAHLVLGLSSSQIVYKALEYYKVYGETAGGCLGNIILVFLTNPADIEIILSSQDHLEKSPEYAYFKPWFGNGLLISKGEHWRHHRKMIAPTFHQSILKSFMPQFVKHSQRVTQSLLKSVGQEIEVHDYMSQITVETLLSTAMGVKKLPADNKCFEYAKAVIGMCDIIHKRQIKAFYRLDAIYKFTKLRVKGDKLMNTLLSMTKTVIAERRKNFNMDTDSVLDEQHERIAAAKKEGLRDDLDDIDDENDVGAKRRLAFLDALLEMSKNPKVEWTEKDVLDEVNTIMFEGHDTISAGSCFALCLLGVHKDVQARVFEEQKQIFADDMQRDCTFDDTLQMRYLERVIKETLRLYPPVPVIARKVNQDVQLASGPYTIPKGATVVIGTFATHRRPDIYANPEEFNPDNHLPELVSKRHYYSYIPFSAGPRSCVGRKYAMLMLKVLLSTLLRKYAVHSHQKESDFQLQGDIILKLANGFKITLELRK